VVRGLNIQIANLVGVSQFPPEAGENLKFWNPGKLGRRAGGKDISFSDFQFPGGGWGTVNIRN
jgi:hypothetical protein